VPHGSVRHHFGGLDGLRHALVDGLLAREVPGDESVEDLLRRWLGPDAPIARARYELMLMASRDEGLRAKVLQGRQVFVDQLGVIGVGPIPARSLVAMLDGLVLDALLRGSSDVDLTLWQLALASALPKQHAQAVSFPPTAAKMSQLVRVQNEGGQATGQFSPSGSKPVIT
jgi:hypothetical protein